MSTSSPWPFIHAERGALASDLRMLSPEQWDTRSLCAEWSVRDVLGHMTATAKMTPPKFIGAMAKSGFRFNAMTAADVARETAGTPAETLAAFESQLTATTHPPGPLEAMLGEAIIHSEDIRRPLGLTREYPQEAVIRVADFFKGSNVLIGAKKRIAGLTLHASDAAWSTGTGLEVTGPALALVLVMTGREAALAELSGDGVATLRSRMSGAGQVA
jgi:uncharacterized protein (TIGR03083 family)